MTTLKAPQELTYEPLGTVPATMHQQRCKPLESGKRVKCPYCGTLKSPGAVVTEQGPTWSTRYECLIGVRSIYCDPCHKRIVWVEQFIGNKPSGEVLAGPFSTSGDLHLANYLNAHPQAQEVEQV